MTARKSSALEPLTKEQVHAKLAQSWSRTIASEFRGNKTAFAGKLGVHPDTVSNALAGTMPELHTVMNSLLACPEALHEVFALYGFQLICIDRELSPDMRTLAEAIDAVGSLAAALEDGKRDHRETLEVGDKLRTVVPKLQQIIAEADELRKPRSVA